MKVKDLRELMRTRMSQTTIKLNNQVVVGDYWDYMDYEVEDLELATYTDRLDSGLVVKPVLIIHLISK